MLWLKSEENDTYEGTDYAKQRACKHLPEVMLTQEHTAGTYKAYEQDTEAEPP